MSSIVNSPPRVMVIDDDTLVLRATRRLLGGRFQVTMCESAAQALAALRDVRPDLIVSDYMIPGEMAAERFAALRAAAPETPLVVMSGEMTAARRAEAHLAGATFCCEKNLATLVSLAERLIQPPTRWPRASLPPASPRPPSDRLHVCEIQLASVEELQELHRDVVATGILRLVLPESGPVSGRLRIRVLVHGHAAIDLEGEIVHSRQTTEGTVAELPMTSISAAERAALEEAGLGAHAPI